MEKVSDKRKPFHMNNPQKRQKTRGTLLQTEPLIGNLFYEQSL